MTKKTIILGALLALIAAGGAYALQPSQTAAASTLNLRPSGLTGLNGQPRYNLPGTISLGQ